MGNEPSIIQFVLNIAGAAALLIWSVRLVRTGVERAFALQLRRGLRRSTHSRFVAAATGMGVAVLLQSSTAVAILISNFVAKGGLATAAGLAILLGADFGSAIVTRILLVPVGGMIPFLLLSGVVLFLRGRQGKTRQIGRIMIGLALIFVSLDMVRSATGPMISSDGTLAAMRYLGTDLATAFIVGAIFAWLVHSSVAAVLLFVTLAGQNILPPMAAAAMVLGANLGGSFIAYVLTLSAPTPARRMVVSNMVLRGGGAALVLWALASTGGMPDFLGEQIAQQIINLHLGYNLGLAIVALPLLSMIVAVAERMMPDRPGGLKELHRPSALDQGSLARPEQALACVTRELLRMGESIEIMLRTSWQLFETWDPETAEALHEKGAEVGRTHVAIKHYLANLNRRELTEQESRHSAELATIAFNFDAASEAVANNLVDQARRLHADGLAFSEKGREEIADFHDQVLSNAQKSLNVLMTQNPDAARDLVAAKDQVRKMEQDLQSKHLLRLREGVTESFETSGIHQETLRILKLVNTSFSIVGYPIVSQSGDLLATRLAPEGDRD